MRAAFALSAALLAACAGRGAAPSATAKPGSSIVKGRFVAYALTPDFTVRILDCKSARGSERVRKDGSFELVAEGCAPGAHRLVFGRDGTGLLKFKITGPVTDVGTIEGDR